MLPSDFERQVQIVVSAVLRPRHPRCEIINCGVVCEPPYRRLKLTDKPRRKTKYRVIEYWLCQEHYEALQRMTELGEIEIVREG